MIKESVKTNGELEIVLKNENGVVKETKKVNNLVVDAGKEHIAARLTGSPTAMSHMAIGSDNTSPVAGDTALGTELGRVSLDSASTSVNVASYSATFGAGVGTGTVREAGILNDPTTGTLLCRTTFSDVNKLAGDTMIINWTITIN